MVSPALRRFPFDGSPPACSTPTKLKSLLERLFKTVAPSYLAAFGGPRKPLLIRTARDEITCQEKGRRSEDLESVEANDWCDNGQSSPVRYLAVHARLMLSTGPRHESFIFSY